MVSEEPQFQSVMTVVAPAIDDVGTTSRGPKTEEASGEEEEEAASRASRIGAILQGRRNSKNDDDPTRNRFVGKYVLLRNKSAKCPFFVQESDLCISYNVDDDLILHMTAQVAPIRKLYKESRRFFSAFVDGGFSKVDPSTGVFKCSHSPPNSYLQLHIVSSESGNEEKEEKKNNNKQQQQEEEPTTPTNSSHLDGSTGGSVRVGVGMELDMVQYQNGKIMKSFRFKRMSTSTF